MNGAVFGAIEAAPDWWIGTFEETDPLSAQKFLPTELDWRLGLLAGEPALGSARRLPSSRPRHPIGRPSDETRRSNCRPRSQHGSVQPPLLKKSTPHRNASEAQSVHGDWGIVMHTLRFLCPVTARTINSGIITTAQSILLMQDAKVNIYCPHCRRTHSARICEACPEEPTRPRTLPLRCGRSLRIRRSNAFRSSPGYRH